MSDHTAQDSLIANSNSNTIENLLSEMVDSDPDFENSDKDPVVNLENDKISSILELKLGDEYMIEFAKLLSFISKSTFLQADSVSDIEDHAVDADEYIIGQTEDDQDGTIRLADPDGNSYELINADELLGNINVQDNITKTHNQSDNEITIGTTALNESQIKTLLQGGSNDIGSIDHIELDNSEMDDSFVGGQSGGMMAYDQSTGFFLEYGNGAGGISDGLATLLDTSNLTTGQNVDVTGGDSVDSRPGLNIVNEHNIDGVGSSGLTGKGYKVDWNSDFAFFGLVDNGHDSKDVAFANEQDSDDFLFYSQGSQIAKITGRGGMNLSGSKVLTTSNINVDDIEDEVDTLLEAGDKLSWSYDASNDNLEITTTARDTEEVEDDVESLLSAGSNLSWSYDDSNDDLEITTSALNAEGVQDEVDSLVSAGTGLSWNYDDSNDDLQLNANLDDSHISSTDPNGNSTTVESRLSSLRTDVDDAGLETEIKNYQLHNTTETGSNGATYEFLKITEDGLNTEDWHDVGSAGIDVDGDTNYTNYLNIQYHYQPRKDYMPNFVRPDTSVEYLDDGTLTYVGLNLHIYGSLGDKAQNPWARVLWVK